MPTSWRFGRDDRKAELLQAAVHRDGKEHGQRNELQDRDDETGTGHELSVGTAAGVESVACREGRAGKQDARTEHRQRMPSTE